MSETQSSYRQIFKATSLFGGVQMVRILVSIVQSKVIALLLGPTGMGIAGLFTSTSSLVEGLTNFGLRTSAVRDISEANESGDFTKVSRVIIVLRRLVWITGFLGLIATFILAPLLSNLTFGSKEYAIAFRWLSVTLLFNQLASGQNVLLQGLRQLKFLAKANIIGAIISLLVSVPLYYFYKIDGIVPALITSSFVVMFIAWLFARKIKIEDTPITKSDTIQEGKSMLTMGFMLSLSSLITVATSYIVRAYISQTGSIADVGLYNAGFAIIGSYVGLVFTAMSTDYYPRLAGVAKDNLKAKELINQQTEIAILILGPILCVFLIFAHWAVVLLYSNEFTSINTMIQWAAMGMYFKAVSWAIAFVFIAKGASNLFFINELVANVYILVLNIIGYIFLGVTGLGVSFLLAYVLYAIQVFIIANRKYDFLFMSSFTKIFIIQFGLGLACFLNILLVTHYWSYILGLIFIGISLTSTIIELEKRMDLKRNLIKYKGKSNDK